MIEVTNSLAVRLARRLVIDPNGCWLWTGYRNGKGYGTIAVTAGRPAFTHRVAFTLINGPIGDDLCVCHKCDVPACCNPTHLFLGTKADNNADMVAKKRMRTPGRIGSQNSLAKLSPADVMFIRASSLGGSELASRFGVCRSNISQIRNHKTWRSV